MDYELRRTEASAVAAMRLTLERYIMKHDATMAQALDSFVRSGMYDDLFDYSLRYWAEGPDYLLCVWKQRMDLADWG